MGYNIAKWDSNWDKEVNTIDFMWCLYELVWAQEADNQDQSPAYRAASYNITF